MSLVTGARYRLHIFSPDVVQQAYRLGAVAASWRNKRIGQ